MTQPIARDAIYRRRRFPRDVIETCVRWYLTYRLNYRDLVALMAERDVHLTHTTIMRWVFRFVPEYEKRWNRRAKPVGSSWRVDEKAPVVALCAALMRPMSSNQSVRMRRRFFNARRIAMDGGKEATRRILGIGPACKFKAAWRARGLSRWSSSGPHCRHRRRPGGRSNAASVAAACASSSASLLSY